MKSYKEVMITIVAFADEDVVRTSVNGNDNQGQWNSGWDRDDPTTFN